MDRFSLVLYTLGYDYAGTFADWEKEVNSGLGILLVNIQHITLLMLILFLPLKSEKLKIYYRILVVGIVLANLCGVNMILSRLPIAYTNLKIVVLSYLYYYIFSNWKQIKDIYKAISIILLITYILLFLVNILQGHSQCSPYNFIEI